jgi:hypothetical protein
LAYADALSTLAEVAIAIAGFSGIVSVFGRRSSGHWSPAERTRLVGLLVMSFTAVFFSVVPFVLLSIPVSESTCWRSLSLLLAASRLGSIAVVLRVSLGVLRIPVSEREVSLATSAIFIAGDLLVVVALSANAVGSGLLWPYLAAIVWVLAEAAVIFVRLVIVPISRAPAV